MVNKVVKRDGTIQKFSEEKIVEAVSKAFTSCKHAVDRSVCERIVNTIHEKFEAKEEVTVEIVQDLVENILMESNYKDVAKAYILYREKHKEMRLIEERVRYISNYMSSDSSAATASETDPNANIGIKNVASIDGEVYKVLNRQIQRYRMSKKLEEMYPEVAREYEKDLEHHIIYTHDEASVPTVKNYCEAVSLYPLVMDGSGTMDGLKTTPPKGLGSFCGQIVNLAFLLASQCKGAVAFGEFFNYFDYYCAKEFGEDYVNRLSEKVGRRTVEETIHQAYQQIVYGWNQPAGNRSYQSPFTNISYYDKNYWHALFEHFYFPDGTQPVWERVSFLQKDFMQWFNKERTKSLLTFPVETMAMLSDGKGDILDTEYRDFTAKMYAEGHSFFTYISSNPDSLSSCCRLRNSLGENTFSFTNGLTGVQTGSVNVISLNLNRIIQDWYKSIGSPDKKNILVKYGDSLKDYLISILERVYKYHKAFKELIYEVESKGMLTASIAGYIFMSKLFSTIGLNGMNEAAEFLGMKCSYNEDYKQFCNLITGTISEENKNQGSDRYMFNTEMVPAESLSSKNYRWDKEDGYWVPENRNLYNSYFYLAEDPETSILDRFRLHGQEFTGKLDGGSAVHCNLEEHLSKEQYLKLIKYAVQVGCNYFTFNIPNSQCEDCGHIVKHGVDRCPKCGSTNISLYTRIIGYLRKLKDFDKERYLEAKRRVYLPKDNLK